MMYGSHSNLQKQNYSAAASRPPFEPVNTSTVRYIKRVDPSFEKPFTPIPRARGKPVKHFDEIIAQIYDEFKFLDEPDVPSPSRRSNCLTPSALTYCLLPSVQLLFSSALIVLATLRTRQLVQTENSTVRLVSSENPAGVNLFSLEAQRILGLEAVLGTFLPAIFQAVSALFGFWPIAPGKNIRRAMQTLHIIFTCISIFLWVDTIYDFSLEIVLDYLQNPASGPQTEKLITDTVLLFLGYLETLILPAITLAVAAFKLGTSDRLIKSNVLSVSISLGSVIFATSTLIVAVFAAQASLSGPSAKWTTLNEELNKSGLFAYGLKDAIVFGFVAISAIFSLVAATLRRRGLVLAATIGQGLSIALVTSHVVTSERLTSLALNVQIVQRIRQDVPISELTLILLSGCCATTCALLTIQLAVFRRGDFFARTKSPTYVADSVQRTQVLSANRYTTGPATVMSDRRSLITCC
ncbi:unnamed protein product [Caenorhabditis auriculariae]|uniref:Uncharacterized protein n=1 Tax=Caenorhabditis auriculariae TaxID=2777116 RepID=A0A8S1HTK6_9PELO|nr:unnamed protein product [Caenorhabditis auriculariae]